MGPQWSSGWESRPTGDGQIAYASLDDGAGDVRSSPRKSKSRPWPGFGLDEPLGEVGLKRRVEIGDDLGDLARGLVRIRFTVAASCLRVALFELWHPGENARIGIPAVTVDCITGVVIRIHGFPNA